MTSHAETVLAAIESLQGTLQIAAALLQTGRTVDLAGLDEEAARLCMAIGTLPESQAISLRPNLEALVRDLDRVSVALPSPLQLQPD